MKEKTVTNDNSVQALMLNQLCKDDENIVSYLKCAYHLAKTEQPKSQFPAVIELVECLGIQLTKDECAYTNHRAITEFQTALADVVLDETLDKINSSHYFAISIDESTDRANHKKLIMYVDYLNNYEKHTRFLSNMFIEKSTANAETITHLVLQELKSKGINLQKLIGISTDGASVMTGRHNGVVKRLRDEIPELIGVHCAAHRCSLAASQAAKFVPELQSYARTVSNIFYYFSNSALRSNKLREIQSLLNMPTLKYAEIHSVRWLSLDSAVRVIYRTYPALVIALEHEATTNASAKGLLTEVQQFKFIMCTHLLMDILPFLSRISKVFQCQSVDFSKISPIVDSTVNALNDMKESPGVYVEMLDVCMVQEDGKVLYRREVSESSKKAVDESVQCNVSGFEGFDSYESKSTGESDVREVEVKYYVQQKNIVSRVLPQYVDKVVSNLEDRFGEQGILSLFCIFVPSCIVSAEREGSQSFLKFGLEELNNLLDKFEKSLTIDRESCVSEYRQFKRLVIGSYAESNFASCVQSICQKYHEIMPNVVKFLQLGVVIPVSSVPCERGFSTQNRILSKLRTSLSTGVITDLMRISEDGCPMKQFDFSKALCKWKCDKQRRYYRV